MKPNENNVILPPQQRPFRVLIISGSEPTESNGIGTYSAMERAELKSSGRPPNKYRAFGYKPAKHIWQVCRMAFVILK